MRVSRHGLVARALHRPFSLSLSLLESIPSPTSPPFVLPEPIPIRLGNTLSKHRLFVGYVSLWDSATLHILYTRCSVYGFVMIFLISSPSCPDPQTARNFRG